MSARQRLSQPHPSVDSLRSSTGLQSPIIPEPATVPEPHPTSVTNASATSDEDVQLEPSPDAVERDRLARRAQEVCVLGRRLERSTDSKIFHCFPSCKRKSSTYTMSWRKKKESLLSSNVSLVLLPCTSFTKAYQTVGRLWEGSGRKCWNLQRQSARY